MQFFYFNLYNFTKSINQNKKSNSMKILHISGAKGWGGNEQQMMYILPE